MLCTVAPLYEPSSSCTSTQHAGREDTSRRHTDILEDSPNLTREDNRPAELLDDPGSQACGVVA